jgi:IS5 family transposase
MKQTQTLGFANLMTQRRKIKAQFFEQINKVVDWRPISNLINKHYQKGMSADGRPSYDGLLLFKMSLLQTWYGLSDYEVEDRLNYSISFSLFAGLSIDSPSPDHSVLSRFRTELTKKKVYDKLFKELNKQLEKHKVIIKTGAIVDVSITPSPLKPRGKTTYEIPEDRSEACPVKRRNKKSKKL